MGKVWLLSLVALACAASFVVVDVAPAQTAQLPEVVEDNIEGVAQFYADQSGTNVADCGPACRDLKADYERPATVDQDPVRPGVVKSFIDASPGTFAGLKRVWSLVNASDFLAGGAVGALTVANYYVWKIGVYGPIKRALFVSIPKQVIDGGVSLRFSDGGDTSPFLYSGFDNPDPIPVGWIFWNPSLWAIQWTTITPTTPGGSFNCQPFGSPMTVPAHFIEYTWHWNRCDGYAGTVHAHGIKYDLRYAFQSQPGVESMNFPDTSTFANANSLTLEEIEERLRAMLASDDPDYKVIPDFLCAALGGPCKNPKDRYPTTPDCTGMTATACTQLFRDAGFVGDITTQTLSADQAVMETPAGKVTATYPHEGIEIAAPRAIRLYVNPDPMPTMTTTQLSLADTLETQNPTTVNDSNKRTLARTCSEDMNAAGRPASECLALPMLVMGNDQETPARNALQGLLRNPAWVVLNARVSKGLNRNNWYGNLGEPAPGCLTDERKPSTASCDEYPFWSTLQAHNGTLSFPGLESSIRWAPREEQTLQAKVINQFFSENSAGEKMWFHGCGIVKQPPTDIAPTLASAFIVMPLPFSSHIKSTGVCNKVVPTDNTPDPTEDPDP
ncbi:PASTA domain-containing protein [Baekduia sp. Peel2402]|uniref:PASTA domain-containing protein n=1 Tax=Baekduia sp. Peel2402 TaxID=3458296 RepID=UPI00403EAB79